MKLLLTAAILALTVVATSCRPAKAAGPRQGYQERRKTFQTKLLVKGPSPQEYRNETPPEGVREITYPSGDLKLKAWVFRPKTEKKTKSPALVYFHGGFAFGSDDLKVCNQFMDAGFVVMTPMLRGENGNPGNFEMWFGEVDDAGAAVRWLAELKFVDSRCIYTFGHSAGGVISALLSLQADLPVRMTGSAGGLYGPEVFAGDDIVPFKVTAEETSMRSLIGNVPDMKLRHLAYCGKGDRDMHVDAAAEAKDHSLLTVHVLDGNHFTSLEPAIQLYFKEVQADLKSAREAGPPSQP